MRVLSHIASKVHLALRLSRNLEAADNTRPVIIEGTEIDVEILREPNAEYIEKILVVSTAATSCGVVENIGLAPQSPLLGKDEDPMVLHARHPPDVFFTGGSKYIEGAGVRSSQVCFLLEVRATRKGIDPNWVVLEELGGYE